MRIELTLQLERGVVIDPPAHATVAELVRLGGWLTAWQQETDDGPARLTFVFADRTNRDRFLKAALRVPGVSR